MVAQSQCSTVVVYSLMQNRFQIEVFAWLVIRKSHVAPKDGMSLGSDLKIWNCVTNSLSNQELENCLLVITSFFRQVA